MRIRQNIRSLKKDQIKDLVDALIQLKKSGRYDQYVHWHHHVMHPSIWSWEPEDSEYRNRAHRGPAFLPWHREFLLQVENDLRDIDNSLALPYWNWTEDAADPINSPLWSSDFLGGNGKEEDHWRVADGPFAYNTGNWPVDPIDDDNPRPGLKRQFGLNTDTLPTQDDVKLALREQFYDTPPYNQAPFTVGFRNRLEGWITKRGDPNVKTNGTQLHNRVHVWVGGNMLEMTSPDDPVFFLHHCYVDKIWADWQDIIIKQKPNVTPMYAPLQDGPKGHNLDDQLKPWTRTIRETLNIAELDYSYEQPPREKMLLQDVIIKRSPFME